MDFEYIQIEPTFNCNLLCTHCGRGKRYVGKEMSLDGLQFVLDQLKDFKIEKIAFNGGGEVFTHKKVEEMFSMIAGRGYLISTVSNGTLLHKKNMEYIIRNKLLFHMILSLEGATRETYESIRGEKTYDIFINNIRRIQELKDKWDSPYPIITLNVVCMKKNLEELPLIVDFAKRMDIREILFVHLSPLVNPSPRLIKSKLCVPDQHLSKCDKGRVQEVFQIIKEKTKDKHFSLVKIPSIEFKPSQRRPKAALDKPYCPWLHKRSFISLEGFVVPCCHANRHIIHFGNIFKKNFLEIWNSEQYTEFRENFFRGKPHPVCAACNEYNGIGFG